MPEERLLETAGPVLFPLGNFTITSIFRTLGFQSSDYENLEFSRNAGITGCGRS